MQPTSTFNSTGNATVGTVRQGPFIGPLTVNETGDPFLVVDTPVTIADATIDAAGAAPEQKHAYRVAVGDPNSVRGVVYSQTTNPGSAQRTFPVLTFVPGERVYITEVQLTEAGTPAAEATSLTLTWKKTTGSR